MFWNRKGLFTDVWIVILLIVFLPALAHAEAYDGMCADTYDASLPPNCAEGVFEQVSVTDTTDCECEFGGVPDCPDGTEFLDTEQCGLFGGCQESVCVDTCETNGVCVECEPGFWGPECANPCVCSENGTCNEDVDGDGSCACDEGWAGAACDFCAPGFFGPACTPCDCGEDGICADGIFGDGSCSCAPPNAWNGETCVLPICDSDPEIANIDGANSPCEGTFWGSSCSFQCAKGFEPKGSALCEAGGWLGGICSDINECLTGQATCSPNGFCANNEGGFSCSCNGGYEGDGETCTNINECETLEQPCGENANCADTPGSYECKCKAGYALENGECVEIDECEKGIDTCSDNAFCANTPGSFTCTCYAGFQGDGETCTDVDECEEPLALEAVCTTPELPCEDVECVAAVSALDSFCTGLAWDAACVACASGGPGFEGLDCSAVGNACLNSVPVDGVCDPNATCANTEGGYTCTCPEGFTGNGVSCEDIPECTPVEVVQLCGVPNEACTVPECLAAVAELDSFCTEATWDELCTTCAAGGIGFNGADCSGVVDACTAVQTGPSPCDPNGVCTEGLGDFSCACKEGYEGDGFACIDVDECATGTATCSSNATCLNTEGGFECACNDGFLGDGVTCCDDQDGDGVCAETDLCPSVFDPGQEDGDQDGVGDACECPEDVVCDDANPCTADTCDPVSGCVFVPVEGTCDDGNVCTANTCSDGVCTVTETADGCCSGGTDCGPGAVCELETNSCLDTQCTPCEIDEECGKGSSCEEFFSGTYCISSCAGPAPECGEEEVCTEGEGPLDGALCLPLAGDCVCAPTDDVACDDGSLYAVDSCGELTELVSDCSGLGCEMGVCLGAEEGGAEEGGAGEGGAEQGGAEEGGTEEGGAEEGGAEEGGAEEGGAGEGGAEEGGAEEGGAEEGGAEEGGAEEGGAEEGGAEEGGAEEGGAEEGGAEEGGAGEGGSEKGGVDSLEGGDLPEDDSGEITALSGLDEGVNLDASPAEGGCAQGRDSSTGLAEGLLLGMGLWILRRKTQPEVERCRL